MLILSRKVGEAVIVNEDVTVRLLEMAARKIKIVAVSDVLGAVYNKKGIDVKALLEHHTATGSVVGFKKADPIDDLITAPCDVLLPCALSNAITKNNAEGIQARLIVEGANGPTTPKADAILTRRGVFIVPAILANAGGVIVSYYEWVQNREGFYWEEEEVNTRLYQKLKKAYNRVADLAAEKKITMRQAAFCLALEKICTGMVERGEQ